MIKAYCGVCQCILFNSRSRSIHANRELSTFPLNNGIIVLTTFYSGTNNLLPLIQMATGTRKAKMVSSASTAADNPGTSATVQATKQQPTPADVLGATPLPTGV